MRDKLAEKGDEERGGGEETGCSGDGDECDRDKELTQRCLKLLMTGRNSNATKVDLQLNIVFLVFLNVCFFINSDNYTVD